LNFFDNPLVIVPPVFPLAPSMLKSCLEKVGNFIDRASEIITNWWNN